jgi:Glycosyl transferase family 2
LTGLARSFKAPPSSGAIPARSAPTFTVVIAVRDGAATIAEAIDSVLAQTEPAAQLIVCDDGSTDGTAAVVERYGEQVTYLRRDRGGVAAARNAALAIASAEFFAVLDADDVFRPERLEALGQLARARPDLDVLSTDAFFERDGALSGTFSATCPFEIADQKAAILERCFCPWPAVRRETLGAIGGFDESLRTGSDWECAIRLIHVGARAGIVEEPLYGYRVHDKSLTADRVRTLQDRVAFLERVGRTYELGSAERTALERSLTRQRNALALTEAEAALRSLSPDARERALALVRRPGLTTRTRAAALAATLAPRTAGRVLERRARKTGASRLARSLPRA